MDPAVLPTVNTSPFSRMTYCFLPLSLFLSVGRLRHFPARAESEGAGLHRHLLQVQGAARGDYQVRLPAAVLRTRVGTTCWIPFLRRVDCFTEIMIGHLNRNCPNFSNTNAFRVRTKRGHLMVYFAPLQLAQFRAADIC